MAELDRKLQKIFAKDATNNGQFGSAEAKTFVKSTDLDVLQNLSAYEDGWLEAVVSEGTKKLPTLEEMQALHYISNYQIKATHQQGVPKYLATEEYFVDGFCSYNGKIYRSSIDSNTGTTPDSDTTKWSQITQLDKYFINGFISKSSSGTPDEDIDITKGKAICEDGKTIVTLDSDVTDLSLSTLNGGALSADTTYHLFRYLKSDNTMQWYLDTTLTPTIADIKSAKAYRRVLGIIVDSSSDIRHFISIQVGTGYYLSYDIKSVDLNSGSAQSNALIAIAVPSGLNIISDSTFRVESTTDPERGGGTIASYNQTANQEVEAANVNDGVVNKKCVTNTSRQIKNHRVVDVGSPNFFIYTNGYTDNRNYY